LFTIERREKLNVLILDAGRPKQSFLLKTAFTARPDLPFNVTVNTASAASPADIAAQDVLILNDVPRLSDAARDRMVEARKTGQGQFVILGQNADLGWWGSVPGFPAKPVQKVDVSNNRARPSVYLTSYNRNHGIFKPFQGTARIGLDS